MRVVLKAGILAFSVEDDEELEAFTVWREARLGHVFGLESATARGGSFHDLGPREDACREPINIVSDMGEVRWRPIGNLALTPFALRGRSYASVEGFWQGLKFATEEERQRVAALWGISAKAAGQGRPARQSFSFDGSVFQTGGPGHHALMLEACQAKFSQNLEAREALLATGDRPLTHRVRRDSAIIPGVLLADYWMRIRRSLR
ncbi:hypothetical protein [Phenylobacterium sp.]|uniref:hypothetical protein n=1 Tax=Phenylobacterium sp. TaxID=1871053 RepID=UPI00286CFD38|nr:hypothetical protein [Phenylobacterium sp.]